MSEIRIGIGSFLPTTFETALKITPTSEVTNFSGIAMLSALRASFKDDMKIATLKENPHRVKYFFASTRLAVAMNDYEDLMPYAKKINNISLQESIAQTFQKTQSDVIKIIQESPIAEQQRMSDLHASYVDEIHFLEQYARLMPHDFHHVREYREIMNAINVTHFANVFLGVYEPMQPALKELSFIKIQEKYKWVTEGIYKNTREQKINALYNIVMGMQVIDDEIDKDSDSEINAPNIARSINSANSLNKLRNDYFDKAIKCGISKTSVVAIKDAFTVIKKRLNKSSKNSRMYEHQMLVNANAI